MQLWNAVFNWTALFTVILKTKYLIINSALINVVICVVSGQCRFCSVLWGLTTFTANIDMRDGVPGI